MRLIGSFQTITIHGRSSCRSSSWTGSSMRTGASIVCELTCSLSPLIAPPRQPSHATRLRRLVGAGLGVVAVGERLRSGRVDAVRGEARDDRRSERRVLAGLGLDLALPRRRGLLLGAPPLLGSLALLLQPLLLGRGAGSLFVCGPAELLLVLLRLGLGAPAVVLLAPARLGGGSSLLLLVLLRLRLGALPVFLLAPARLRGGPALLLLEPLLLRLRALVLLRVAPLLLAACALGRLQPLPLDLLAVRDGA